MSENECTFRKTDPADLTELKEHYLRNLAAPLDGMWECFVNMGEHYSIVVEDDVVGYAVVNSDQKLLQFFVTEEHDGRQFFSQLIGERNVVGAYVATCEPHYLSFCLDHQQSVVVNAIMYHINESIESSEATFPSHLQFRLVETGELGASVDFAAETLGADRSWLSKYFTERIERNELFGLWQRSGLIATGECRLSETQKPVADLGMVVSRECRGEGIGTTILKKLIHRCHERDLLPICSTERENIAAQKAIERSGFTGYHRILEIQF